MKEIILFGTGKYFCHKQDIVSKYHVKYIIDNKIQQGTPRLWEKSGISMMNPQDIDKDDSTEIYLMSMHFISMWKQLISLGVTPSRIVYPYFEEPFFQSDYVVDQCVKRMTFEREAIHIECKDDLHYIVRDEDEWYECLRSMYRKRYNIIGVISDMLPYPVSEQFATERGTPVDRYYIDDFLENHSQYIKGDVLEIEDNTYTKKFGKDKVRTSIVMDVCSTAPIVDFNANLETGEGIRDGVADCFILTQTLMYIFDLKSAARNISRLLKGNGTVLITCSGISQNSQRCMDNYGAYFNFNVAVFERMFEEQNDMQIVDVGSYGNVKTVSAHINGLCCEDLQKEDFIQNDKCYPLIVYAMVKKNEYL